MPPSLGERLGMMWNGLAELTPLLRPIARRLHRGLAGRFNRWDLRAQASRSESAFLTEVRTKLDVALRRALHQEYEAVHATENRGELITSRVWRLRPGTATSVFVPAGLIIGTALGIDLGGIAPMWGSLGLDFTQWMSIAGLGTGGVLGLVSYTREQRTSRMDLIQEAYRRDNSLASLKQDLDEILALLSSPDTPREYRVVIVLDELDKIESNQMLDRVIESFKNLFTLTGAVFVFITDKDYFDHVMEAQEKAAQQQSYAPHHTFFTRKIFLSRSDFRDVRAFLNSIYVPYGNPPSPREQADWDVCVKYLTFESRSHLFDLVNHLSSLVDSPRDSRPVLLFSNARVPKSVVQRAARFQAMVEIVYEQDRYTTRLEDHLNNDLLGQLYAVFGFLQFQKFTRRQVIAAVPEEGEETDLHRDRVRNATERLLELLVACDAVEVEEIGDGDVEYAWTGRCEEPRDTMLDLHRRKRELIDRLEGVLVDLKALERAVA